MSRPAGKAKKKKKKESPGTDHRKALHAINAAGSKSTGSPSWHSRSQVRSRKENRGSQSEDARPPHSTWTTWGLRMELLTNIPLPKLEESHCPSEEPCLSLLWPGDHPAGPHLSRPVWPENHTLPRSAGQPAPAPKPGIPGPYPRSPHPGRAPAAEGGSAQPMAGRETRHVCSSVIWMLILS